MSEAPERIGIISDGLGLWALADKSEASCAVHYVRADRIEELEAKVKNLTAHHPNMADPRYWEGRYRGEKASVQELEAEVAAITAHSVKLADELATARSHYADESDAHAETSAKLERAVYVIGGFQTAIKTGRNEPLMIWSDQANILLADLKGGAT